MSDEPFDFDFNNVELPPRYELAAENTKPGDLALLYRRLHDANALWRDPLKGERAAALAALRAVTRFLAANEYNGEGIFSRPLDLLARELMNSGAPDPGNILAPWTPGQTAERGRREAVNHLKAASAFVADRLHGQAGQSLKEALHQTAEVLGARRFPLADYIADDDDWKPPTVDELTKKIDNWRDQCKRNRGEYARFWNMLSEHPPFDARPRPPESVPMPSALDWLRSELERAGFTAR